MVGSEELVVTCGCLSSVENSVEAAEVCERDGCYLLPVTCDCLSSEDADVEAVRVVSGWLVVSGG
jgi:hypothetical protein